MSDIEKYGSFVDHPEGVCFELRETPPKKWVNLHYNQCGPEEIYVEISNIGDGPVTYRDDDGRTCTVVGYDKKFLYVRDDDSGVVFNPFGEPVPTPVEKPCCRYFPHKTVISGECEGLKTTHRIFAPREEALEAWTVTVENTSDRPRTISLFAYAGFQLNGADADQSPVPNENESIIPEGLGGVFVHNRHRHVPEEGKYNGFIIALNDFYGACGYRDYFTRSDFSLSTPNILWGWDADGRTQWGPDCAGIVQVKLSIPARETGRADFLIGPARDPEEVHRIRSRVDAAYLDRACEEQAEIDRARNAAFQVDTGHHNLDALLNHFAKKQMVGYLVNKSGFRDNLQTDMALALCDYPLARANLLRALASQYPDGRVPHGFRPLNDLTYADKPAWILQVVPAMIKESGDEALLDEVVPYFRSDETGTVWDHMLRTMRYLAHDTGEHGLCDQHFADWNDGLEPSEETGERESVMVTQQLCLGLREMEELARRRREDAVAEEARKLFATFSDRLNKECWDGAWYQRTLCGSGYRIGTDENPEAKIFLNTQVWAVLSDTAPEDRARLCMESVDRYLEKDIGFTIVDPPFTRFNHKIGKFSALKPHHATNGGCYNHAAGFKAVADCMLGRADAAWRTFVKIAPDNPENPVSRSWTEPFSFTNCYEAITEQTMYGRSQYPWRTGTVNWFAMLVVEWIPGARRHYDGLLIDPCLTKTIPQARLTRAYRGAIYEIEIDNTAGRETGVRELTVDGTPVEGPLIAPFDGGTHRVRVVI